MKVLAKHFLVQLQAIGMNSEYFAEQNTKTKSYHSNCKVIDFSTSLTLTVRLLILV